MANIAPASNVQAAAFAGFISVMVLHVCAANDIIIPADVADSLPGAIAVLVVHIWDCWQGTNRCNG